jgi:hypothetical protein
MNFLLNFFGAATLAPGAVLKLKALLIAAMAMLLVVMAVTTWAMFERSRYFETRAELATCAAQVSVLAGTLERQGKSIETAAAAGTKAVEVGEKLLREARQLSKQSKGALDAMEKVLGQPVPKRADGKDKDCGDARRELRAIRGGKQ